MMAEELDRLADEHIQWPLSLDEVHELVEYLIYEVGSTKALMLANHLNVRMGSSARRFAVRRLIESGQVKP